MPASQRAVAKTSAEKTYLHVRELPSNESFNKMKFGMKDRYGRALIIL